MIRRGKHDRNFTCLPNTLINDERLSAEETGCLVYLLSKPQDWIVTMADLKRRFAWGREKNQRVIKGLLDNGYLTRDTQRSHGRFAGYDYIVHDCIGGEISETESPPSVAPPETAKPVTVKPAPYKERIGTNGRSPSLRSDDPLFEGEELFRPDSSHQEAARVTRAREKAAKIEAAKRDFAEFWDLWPNKQGKKKCAPKYEMILFGGEAPHDEIMAGLRRYMATKPADRPWLNPFTFLNQARWADQPAAPDEGRKRSLDDYVGRG